MVGFVIGVAACSTSTQPDARVFDPCAPPRLDAPAASDAQRATIAGALELWRTAGLAMPETASDVAIAITFEPSAPALYGFYDGVATIYINVELGGDKAAITLAHELGHAFGLVHIAVETRGSVMNPGNLTIAPTDEDRAAIEAIWGRCAPE